MERIREIINSVSVLPEAPLEKLSSFFQKISCKKGTHLFRQHEIDQTLYFIETGLARAYNQSTETDVTFWFGTESSSVLSYNSYINGTPGYESVELLEDAVLYKMDYEHLEKLYTTDIDIANWGRKLLEKEIVKVEELLISRLLLNASERYKNLIESHPQLLQRVQLNYIASYLGITPVSLSRIRAEIR